MTELELIIDLHRNSERQGPGSEQETLKALELIHLPEKGDVWIADIGCGSGGQTVTLAQNIDGQIVAIDLFPEFLEELNIKSKELGLLSKIQTIAESMDKLPFEKNFFDIIWSEGAIYNIGFETGIKTWKEYLKAGGYFALSEATWITDSRPQEVEAFWKREYPEMDTASNKIKILEDNGFSLVGCFYLEEDSWVENYYKPMEARFPSFLERNNNSEMAKEIVREHRKEIDLYLKYKEYYSYGFYIAKKNN